MTAKASNAGILGTGFYVPEKIVTNFDLEKMVDTSDAWIVERTGIHERRVAEDHVPMSELAFKAAEMALADAGQDQKALPLAKQLLVQDPKNPQKLLALAYVAASVLLSLAAFALAAQITRSLA